MTQTCQYFSQYMYIQLVSTYQVRLISVHPFFIICVFVTSTPAFLLTAMKQYCSGVQHTNKVVPDTNHYTIGHPIGVPDTYHFNTVTHVGVQDSNHIITVKHIVQVQYTNTYTTETHIQVPKKQSMQHRYSLRSPRYQPLPHSDAQRVPCTNHHTTVTRM